MFGEVSLLYNTQRTASVHSLNYCTIAAINSKSWADISEVYPDVITRMKRHARSYRDPWKTFLKRLLRGGVHYLEHADDELVEELTYLLKPESIEEGTEVIPVGTECKKIYFLIEGEVRVFIERIRGGPRIHLDTLYQGCSIG